LAYLGIIKTPEIRVHTRLNKEVSAYPRVKTLSGNMAGTVTPAAGFNPEEDCNKLRKAMKGLGTDEKAIIDILSNRSNQQRQEIKLKFKTMFGRDLVSDLKSELSGKFEDVVVGAMMPLDEYDAYLLHHAIKGAGTDESCLLEVLCSRNNAQVLRIKELYKKLYKKDLEKDLKGDTSGHFGRLMVSLSTGGRVEGVPVDAARAQADAQVLYKAGQAHLGTDESKFNQILAAQSFEQLRAVFSEYHKLTGKTMEQAIKSEMSGNLESGMLSIVSCVQNPSGFFADRLYKSMKGGGTNDQALIRVVVSRSEVDMVQIKHEFQAKYGQSLAQFIKDDCSGDYKKMLLALVK
jgi:hypothetical protein